MIALLYIGTAILVWAFACDIYNKVQKNKNRKAIVTAKEQFTPGEIFQGDIVKEYNDVEDKLWNTKIIPMSLTSRQDLVAKLAVMEECLKWYYTTSHLVPPVIRPLAQVPVSKTQISNRQAAVAAAKAKQA